MLLLLSVVCDPMSKFTYFFTVNFDVNNRHSNVDCGLLYATLHDIDSRMRCSFLLREKKK